MSHYRDFRQLLKVLREDRLVNCQDVSMPGFRALAVHRLGMWIKTLPAPLPAVLSPFHGVARRWVRNHHGIDLYLSTVIGRRVALANQGNISIHKESIIGDDCVIRQNATLGGVSIANNHGPRLGRGVEVGAGAVIIGPIMIGDGARIGPNVVVTMDVPAGAIAVAAPPRLLPGRPAKPAIPANQAAVGAGAEPQPAGCAHPGQRDARP